MPSSIQSDKLTGFRYKYRETKQATTAYLPSRWRTPRPPHTASKYRIDFERFLGYIKIHDLDVLLDLGKEAIQELVIKYTKSLRYDPQKKYARSTVNSRVSAILYFFDNNEIELNKRKIRRYYPSDESVNDDRPYSIGEIQQILSVCDLRMKAMILLPVNSFYLCLCHIFPQLLLFTCPNFQVSP
jgi:hypothetical protein